MNTPIKIALAAFLSTAALGTAAHAQVVDENVSIVYLETLSPGDGAGTEYDALTMQAQNPAALQEVQQQAAADPAVQNELANREIALHNVIGLETAADGSKIVYVR